jgi:hypothetical protein
MIRMLTACTREVDFQDEAGALVNHSHNYSLIACVF